jgi:hypothetical protein
MKEFNEELWQTSFMVELESKLLLAMLVYKEYHSNIKHQGQIIETHIGDFEINKHKYFAFNVGDIENVQKDYESMSPYISCGASGLCKAIEKDVGSLILSPKIESVTADRLTPQLIRGLHTSFNRRAIPHHERYLAITPEIAKNNKLFGFNITSGGSIYGITIVITDALPIIYEDMGQIYTGCMAFQSEAFAFVPSNKVRMTANESGIVGDFLYGIDLLLPSWATLVKIKKRSNL